MTEEYWVAVLQEEDRIISNSDRKYRSCRTYETDICLVNGGEVQTCASPSRGLYTGTGLLPGGEEGGGKDK